MATTVAPEPTTYRWPSTDEADRFAVEDLATGERTFRRAHLLWTSLTPFHRLDSGSRRSS